MDIGAGMERYETFRHFAIEGLREFQWDMAQQVKTVRLSLTAWKSILLPVDFVDWALLGIEIDNTIQVFTNDERIPLPTLDEDEDGELDAPTVATEYPTEQIPGNRYAFYGAGGWGQDKGELYGLLAKSNGIGYYKMNTERREIQFTPSLAADTIIYMEYISDGFNPTEKTVVNIYAGKLLKLYIHKCRHMYAKSSSVADKRLSADEYDKEWSRVQSRISPITAADVIECARDGYKLITGY